MNGATTFWKNISTSFSHFIYLRKASVSKFRDCLRPGGYNGSCHILDVSSWMSHAAPETNKATSGVRDGP
jgi:hypothetical protein